MSVHVPVIHSSMPHSIYDVRSATNKSQAPRTILTAVSTNARAGSGNGLKRALCLMPLLFLFTNHIVLLTFWMIGALRKPWHSSCTSALCCSPHISHYDQHGRWETSKPWMQNLHPLLALLLRCDSFWSPIWSGCCGNWTSLLWVGGAWSWAPRGLECLRW